MMARVLGVKESAYYQWRKRHQAAQERRSQEVLLVKTLRAVFDESEQTYGYRKMVNALAEYGIYLSEYRVRSIMRSNGMYPVTCTKYRPASSGKKTGRYLDNLFGQDFSTVRLDEKWAGDITYIKTKIGWVYLACVIDLHNKEIVGYSIAKKADAELVCRALSYALIRRDITKDDGLVFHCDRGVQYASKRFQTLLKANDVTGSMSRAGCPFDNAPAESFFSTAKRERIYRRDYQDISEVRIDLFDYIEVFYNGKRIQAGLGYKSPLAVRAIIESKKAA
jgi:transposase InsO family protein